MKGKNQSTAEMSPDELYWTWLDMMAESNCSAATRSSASAVLSLAATTVSGGILLR